MCDKAELHSDSPVPADLDPNLAILSTSTGSLGMLLVYYGFVFCQTRFRPCLPPNPGGLGGGAGTPKSKNNMKDWPKASFVQRPIMDRNLK